MGMPIKLKVICLNLWMGGLLFDEILEFLKNEDPDLILLQEVYNGHNTSLKRNFRSFSVLEEKLGFKYSHFAPAFLEIVDNSAENYIENFAAGSLISGEVSMVDAPKQKIEQGNAIFSKFPLESQETRFYDVPFGSRIDEFEYYSVTPRNLQHVVIDLSGQDLQSHNFHVFNTQGIWDTHGDDTDRRLKMGDIIVNEVSACLESEKAPLLLAGDFNFNTNTKTVKNIESVLESIFKSDLKTSFNFKRKDLEKDPGYATSAVDMMFVSKDLRVVKRSCPDVDVSDHLPLIAELELG